MSNGLPWVWSPAYEMDIGVHVFPTVKYRLVKERLTAEGVLREEELHLPAPAGPEELARAHTPAYVEKALAGRLSPAEECLLELPFSAGLLEGFRVCCGGTTLAARLALERGVAVHLGGGFHHAFPDHGEGFCLFNDVGVAVQVLRAEGRIRRAAVVDLDVHHGNGTAAMFQREAAVFTFDMHQERNYPFPKPRGDLDVALEDGMADARYLELLREHLPDVLEGHRPELVVYLAGADPYREDQLGGLALTPEGLRQRDRTVLAGCRDAGVPVVVVLAGGYALRRDDTVEIHCGTVREARATFPVGG